MNRIELSAQLGCALLLVSLFTACDNQVFNRDTPVDTLLPQATFGGYEVDVVTTKEWSGGFKGAVVLTNTGGASVNSFELTFKLSGGNPIRNSWGGTFSAPSGDGTLTLNSPNYLTPIVRGESFESGFVADNAFAGATITSLKVNGQDVGGGGTDRPHRPAGP